MLVGEEKLIRRRAMNRSLIMSIALVSLIAMGSPAMADRGVRPNQPGNSGAGKALHGTADPNCRGDRASLFAIATMGLGTGNKLTNAEEEALMTDLIRRFFNDGAIVPDCTD
jgi:hypothetical protein